ncbi:expressed unknown protein [Seminavis robusta]|uniref:Uncharacterized protein n=1 Tax=Seminavis robusta TaxID=568900 RepID=A0A9N8DWX4_9STRA|nr:expressed unknown protein [Seminavis robusta]|eukprot:Sro429_g141030.1 n/a (454) ;mRNA; r:20071-21432
MAQGDQETSEDLQDLLDFFTELISGRQDTGDTEGTQERVSDVDIQVLFANLTIPEDFIGKLNTDILLSSLFRPILAHFGIPGYEQYIMPPRFKNSFPDPVSPFASQCQLCDGDYDKTKSFADISCQAWEIFAGFSEGSECSILRGVAVKSCGCNMWQPDEPVVYPPTCELCQGEKSHEDMQTFLTTYVNANRMLPTLSQRLYCTDILRLLAVDGEDVTCASLSEFGAQFCGCSYVIPPTTLKEQDKDQQEEDICTLCPKGTLPKTPEKVVLLSFDGNRDNDTTCASLHNEFTTLEDLDSCRAGHFQMSTAVGHDVQTFCGCPKHPAPWAGQEGELEPGPCSPCQPGYMVRTDNAEALYQSTMIQRSGAKELPHVNCQDWAKTLATLEDGDDLCIALQASVMPGCCVPEEPQEQEEFPPTTIQEVQSESGGHTLFWRLHAGAAIALVWAAQSYW